MKKHIAVRHAVKFLRRNRYEIIDLYLTLSPAKPHSHRSLVDIVAWDRQKEAIVFIEIKPHESPTKYARRLCSIPKDKRASQRKAINSWLRENKWRGAHRFDIIEIYGEDDNPHPVIDHICDIKTRSRK